MDASKTPEQSQASRHQKLDERYGKIGISAVAAAVRHRGELRNPREAGDAAVYDRD